MFSGLAQCGVLIRKNILLKSRRPKVTLVELTLPIVLFLLLAWVRSKYDETITVVGPFHFDFNPLFPLTSMLFSLGSDGPGVLVDAFNSNRRLSEEHNRSSPAGSGVDNFTSMMEEYILCGDNFGSLLPPTLGPIVDSMLHANDSNYARTMADDILHGNMTEMMHWAHNLQNDMEIWDLQDFVENGAKARSEYFASEWPTHIEDVAKRLDKELKVLRDALDSPNGAAETSQCVENYAKDVCNLSPSALGHWGPSNLSKALVELRDAVEHSGLADWIRGNHSELWQPVQRMLDTMTAENVTSAANVVVDGLESMSSNSSQAEILMIAELADTAVWWLSHYLTPRSVTVRLLGEINDTVDSMTGTMQTPSPDFRTDVGEAVYKGLWRLESGDMDRDRKNGMMDGATNTMMQDASAQLGHVEQSVTSFQEELKKWLDEAKGHNASSLQNNLLPMWEQRFRRDCPKHLNASHAGELFAKTNRGCPFYRHTLREFQSVSLADWTARFHDRMRHWNASRCKKHARDLQNFFPRLKTGQLENIVERVVKDARGAKNIRGAVPMGEVMVRSLMREYRIYRGVRCSGQRSYSSTGSEMGSTEQRQDTGQRKDRGDAGPTGQGDWMMQELFRRKVLVAPYRGEAKHLLELAVVELGLSIAGTGVKGGEVPDFVTTLLRCPLVRAALAMGVDWLIQDRMITFDTEEELTQYAEANPNDVLGAIVFRSADPVTGNFPRTPSGGAGLNVEYAVRMHAQLLPPTGKILRISRYAMFGAARITPLPYMDTGFAYIQEVFGRATARLRAVRGHSNFTSVERNAHANERTALARKLTVGTKQFPAPQYRNDQFIRIIQHTLPSFVILGWIYSVSLLIREMVYEKQERLREVMRIMGLKTWVYWSSWVASSMLQMTVLVAIFSAILCGGRVLSHSSPSVVFFFFWTYSLSTVSFAMLVSSRFDRAKVAAACGGLLYYLMYIPYAAFTKFEDSLSLGGKNAFCLLSPTGIGIGSAMLAKWELIEEGVQWSNIMSPPPITNTGAAPKDGHSMAHIIMMFLIDAVVYQVLAWYIEKVCPGSLGLPQPFYFPILPSYWCGHRVKNADDKLVRDTTTDESHVVLEEAAMCAEQRDNAKIESWEAAPSGLTTVVEIRGLTKKFGSGKQALKGISLDMQDGTIVGLLGHNGAGKSTTMAILTGLYPPTDGDVHVHGVSVRKDALGVRKQLGVCLQHNALYECLTVQEHLFLFSCLKGVPRSRIAGEIDALLRDTGLAAKRHVATRALSGGMKRKLSIGIALTGGSRVIALDEPTAGVDATSRRDIWHLLASHRSQRTMLLSTHFMDEADILSDRIAIIAEGQMTAIGSSMALKRHFAEGYMLTVVVTDQANAVSLTSEVKLAVPEAQFAGSRGRELSFVLPCSSRSQFSGLFDRLQDDHHRALLGIETYGLSAATMEEVFLKASSVHEVGLHGTVRSAAAPAFENELTGLAPPDRRSATDSSTDAGSSEENTSNSDGRASTPSDGGDSGSLDRPATPSDKASAELHMQNTPSDKSSEAPSSERLFSDVKMDEVCDTTEEDERPRSPQCMTSDGPAQMLDKTHQPTESKIAPPCIDFEPVKKDAWKPIEVNEGATNVMGTVVQHKELKLKELLEGTALWTQQFGALMRKRAISVRRDRRAWASQLLLPAMFVFLALVLASFGEVTAKHPPLKMSTDMYIGTLAAGAAVMSLDSHVMPFSTAASLESSVLGNQVRSAFDATKGNADSLRPLNLTGSSMEGYLLENTRELSSTCYGAMALEGTPEAPNITLYFKNRAYHAIPIMVNLWNNARLKLMGMDDTVVQAWSHPLPKTAMLLEEELTGSNQIFQDLTVAVTTVLAMGFIPASFVVYLVHERATSGKHQQLLTGVPPWMYWLTSYIWDYVNYLFPMLICFCIFVLFGLEAYSGTNGPAIFLLLLVYGVCMTPCMYCLEPLFTVPSTAYVLLICTNIFTGTVSVMATTVLDLYQSTLPDLAWANSLCKAVFPVLFPNYCLGRGMLNVATNHYMNSAAQMVGRCPFGEGGCNKDPLSWDVAGQLLVTMLLMAPVWLGLRLLIEGGFGFRALRTRLFGTKTMKEDDASDADIQDPAVLLEKERISSAAQASSSEDHLVMSGLAKTYGEVRRCGRRKAAPLRAVRGINVGVPAGECFGLLGVNGAGKTTTMKMITGDITIGGGDILVGGYSVQMNRDRARRHLGYCPQFDALPDKLTARETLALYARIRGIQGSQVEESVSTTIKRMCLEAHQHTTCERLSGGNKRKLSTAMALIGEPSVILLDEPSTGIDVGARRFLWEVLGDVRRSGHALVLSSHSMDECEVLCTRLTIMAHGQFRCLGSPMQLKTKYGGGYTLAVKAQSHTDKDNDTAAVATETSCAQIREFVKAQIPQAVLSEENVGLLRFRIGGNGDAVDALKQPPASSIQLGAIFSSFEEASRAGGCLSGCVSDYTLSQTSLEEVFLHFSQESDKKEQEIEAVA